MGAGAAGAGATGAEGGAAAAWPPRRGAAGWLSTAGAIRYPAGWLSTAGAIRCSAGARQSRSARADGDGATRPRHPWRPRIIGFGAADEDEERSKYRKL